MTVNEILAIAEFLGDDISDQQEDRLVDACRNLSVVDRERLYANANCIGCRKLYAALSENMFECGWERL